MFPNPLSSDGVDRLNHKWMVLLMLVLSLVAFIVPLHPSYQGPSNEPVTIISQPALKPAKEKPQVPEVNCWCPVQFTGSHVNYVNNYCKNALISLLEGNNETAVTKSVYDKIIPTTDTDSKSVADQLKDYFKILQKQKEDDSERAEMKFDVQRVVTYKTPLLVLGTALMLVLPHALWCFLAECCCSTTNLALTLAAATQACSLDTTSRTQFYNNISSKMSTLSCSSKAAAVLYLIKKLLSVVVVVVLLLVVAMHAQTEVQQLQERLDETSPVSVSYKAPSGQAPTNTNHTSYKTPADIFGHLNSIFFCDFSIRLLSNLQQYSVQCVVTGVDIKALNQIEEIQEQPWTMETTKSTRKEKNLLRFESTILCAVRSVLVICVVANVLSLCGWLYKLLSVSARNSVRLSGTVAMDTALLVHMARINCGPEVALRLAQDQAGE